MRLTSRIAALGLGLFAAASCAIAAAPTSMNFQAYLTYPWGEAVSDTVDADFAILDGPNGTAIWTESQSIDVELGYFSASLGSVQPLTPELFDTNTALYLSVVVDGDRLGPAARIDSVPYAMWAANALSESEIREALSTQLAPETCLDGETVVWDDTNVAWVCAPAPGRGIDGQSVSVVTEAPGTNCPTGGFALTSVSGISYVCNGEEGPDGEPGVGVSVSVQTPGMDCPTGGLAVTDANGTSYVCNGVQGAQGTPGQRGAPGATGAQGQPGIQGDTGPRGEQGLTGAQGPTGQRGQRGLVGATGSAGPQGATGPQGDIGPQGASGQRGDTGPRGNRGIAGEGVEVSAIGPGGNCEFGGVSIVSADGTAFVCNGMDGDGGGTAYGNGGIGNRTISSNTNWSTNPPAAYSFNNLTINSNRTLTVPSGTVIRVAGTFTNNGTIEVEYGMRGTRWGGNPDPFPSLPGNAMTAAQGGGGLAFPAEVIRQNLHPGPFGGGNGRRGNGSPDNDGGPAGGSLVIRAASGLVNNGLIRARGGNGLPGDGGDDGGGGGGGGFIILASAGNIVNSGTINARAGNGVSGLQSDDCGGGGGGGGVIHLLSPNANGVNGTLSVQGGSRGTTICGCCGGSSGGAMGGNGGRGSDDDQSSTNGQAGLVLRTQVSDPGPLF